MARHEYLAVGAAVFLDVFVGPSHGCSRIVQDIIYLCLGQKAVIDRHDYQSAILQLRVDVLVATFDATAVEPNHHGSVFLFGGVIDVELAALLGVGVGGF